MFRNTLQAIFCLMLLCSVGLFAAETQEVSVADNVGYEYELAAGDGFVLEDAVQVAMGLPESSSQPLHGQPLPGTLLSVLLAGFLMKAAARLRRRAEMQKALLTEIFAQSIRRLISIVRYFRTVSSPYTCCWEWQKTVLRL